MIILNRHCSRNIEGELGQCCGCWHRGALRRQDITSHNAKVDIEMVVSAGNIAGASRVVLPCSLPNFRLIITIWTPFFARSYNKRMCDIKSPACALFGSCLSNVYYIIEDLPFHFLFEVQLVYDYMVHLYRFMLSIKSSSRVPFPIGWWHTKQSLSLKWYVRLLWYIDLMCQWIVHHKNKCLGWEKVYKSNNEGGASGE